MTGCCCDLDAGAAAAPVLESHACAHRVDLRSEAVRSAMAAVLTGEVKAKYTSDINILEYIT